MADALPSGFWEPEHPLPLTPSSVLNPCDMTLPLPSYSASSYDTYSSCHDYGHPEYSSPSYNDGDENFDSLLRCELTYAPDYAPFQAVHEGPKLAFHDPQPKMQQLYFPDTLPGQPESSTKRSLTLSEDTDSPPPSPLKLNASASANADSANQTFPCLAYGCRKVYKYVPAIFSP